MASTIASQAGAFYNLISQKRERDKIVMYTDLLRHVGSGIHLSSVSTLATWSAIETFLSPGASAQCTKQLKYIRMDPGTTLGLSFSSQLLIGLIHLFDLFILHPGTQSHTYINKTMVALQKPPCNESGPLSESNATLNATQLYDLYFREKITELKERPVLNHHGVGEAKLNQEGYILYADLHEPTRYWSLGQKQTGMYPMGLYLISVYLTGLHLMGVYLTGVYLMGLYLTGLHLMGAYLMNVCLIGVYLMGVYLMGVHLAGVYLTGVYFMSVRLTGVCLVGMHLIGVNLVIMCRNCRTLITTGVESSIRRPR